MGGSPRYPHQTLLTKGSAVEVTSDDEGFKGAWFEATIVDTRYSFYFSSSRKKKVLVEYKTILADENGSEPLRELVYLCFVRPIPPPIENVEGFELYDVVDAFYKDGWWTGVITRVLQDSGKYQVTFHNPPDELQFPPSELRFHQQWLKGSWVRPGKQRTGALIFSVGKEVQVSFDGEDWLDAWFPATILEDCGNDSFLVEYRRPVPDSNEAAVEKVTVDSFHIRPCPPDLKSNKFNLLEKVDAFYDFGWWSGVITRELADSRYIIFFKQTNKEKELSSFDLRPHMDWKDGQWVTAAKDVPTPSDHQTNGGSNSNDNANILQKDVPVGKSCTMNDVSDERTCIEDLNETPSTDKISTEETMQNVSSTHDAASSQPRELSKEGTEVPKMLLEPSKHIQSPFKTPLTKSVSDFLSQNSEDAVMKISVPLAGDDKPNSRQWKKRSRKRSNEPGEEKGGSLKKLQSPKSREKGSESDKGLSTRTKKVIVIDDESVEPISNQKQTDTDTDTAKDGKQRNQSPELREETARSLKKLQNPRSRTRGGKDFAIENSAEATQKPSISEKISVPIILGLEYNSKATGSRTKRFRQIDDVSPMRDQIDAAIDGSQKTKLSGDGEHQKPGKRMRGRPRRHQLPTDVEPSGGHPNNETSGNVELPNEDGKEQRVKGQMRHSGKSGKMVAPTKKSNEKAIEALVHQPEKHFIRRGPRGKQLPKGGTIESQVQGTVDPTTESSRGGSDVGAGVTLNRFDDYDQPLAKWFEDLQSPTSLDGSRASPAGSPEQVPDLSDIQDMPTQTPVTTTPIETQSLPFVKRALLWETIESMDVFRRIPQKPHFRSLENCKENSREGLAIGFMVTFASIVEKTSKLHYGSPISTIEEDLGTLADLENHGFDVQPVRGRLTEFLLLKDKLEKFETGIAGIDKEINKHDADQKTIDEEIEKINKQIAELQDKLSLAIARKDAKDREIGALRSALEEIQEDMKKALNELEGFAVNPL